MKIENETGMRRTEEERASDKHDPTGRVESERARHSNVSLRSSPRDGKKAPESSRARSNTFHNEENLDFVEPKYDGEEETEAREEKTEAHSRFSKAPVSLPISTSSFRPILRREREDPLRLPPARLLLYSILRAPPYDPQTHTHICSILRAHELPRMCATEISIRASGKEES